MCINACSYKHVCTSGLGSCHGRWWAGVEDLTKVLATLSMSSPSWYRMVSYRSWCESPHARVVECMLRACVHVCARASVCVCVRARVCGRGTGGGGSCLPDINSQDHKALAPRLLWLPAGRLFRRRRRELCLIQLWTIGLRVPAATEGRTARSVRAQRTLAVGRWARRSVAARLGAAIVGWRFRRSDRMRRWSGAIALAAGWRRLGLCGLAVGCTSNSCCTTTRRLISPLARCRSVSTAAQSLRAPFRAK